ncbi:hypothetical protein CLJ1_5850 [Pseudomonas paraeruginosa]|nr:hypothetical protein CLJ1_5850 [Pseudomonas aeruginosa]
MQSTREQVVLAAELYLMYPSRERRPSLLSDLELHWPLCFLLHHYCS